MHTLTKTKLSELNSAVFKFLIRCLLGRDISTLTYLGVARGDVISLMKVRLGDMYHLSGMPHILSTNHIIHRDGLHRLMSIMTQPYREENDENTKITKEGELNESVLRILARSSIEGDISTLEILGVQRKDIEVLSRIRVADVARASDIGSHLLAPNIVLRERFLRAINCTKKAERDDECCGYLIRHDAPLSLLSTLFGITGDHFSNLRRMYDVKGGVGRTKDITSDAEVRIWSAYLKMEKSVDDLSPSDWMTLHKRSNVPLRSIWLFLQRLPLEPSMKIPNNDRIVATTRAEAL